MYIRIKNDILVEYANWQFKDSIFVDIDFDEFEQNKDKYLVKNGELVDVSKSEIYQNKIKLKEIEQKLQEIEKLYFEESQKTIYFNEKQYKFEWTDIYQNILNSDIFPVKIWDKTGLEENAVLMSKDDLKALLAKLLQVKEDAYQTKKETKNILLKQKNEITEYLKES